MKNQQIKKLHVDEIEYKWRVENKDGDSEREVYAFWIDKEKIHISILAKYHGIHYKPWVAKVHLEKYLSKQITGVVVHHR